MKTKPCPCGSGQTLEDCCAPLLSGSSPAPTAEALMRSRYTAFTLQNASYLQRTWHASTRPGTLNLNETPPPKWVGLEVIATNRIDDDHATVEFIARYKIGGRAHRLHETSRFVREHGCWYYVDGDIDGHAAAANANGAHS